MNLPAYALDRPTFPQMYERHLVGPLFRPWAQALLDETRLQEGERVLDIEELPLVVALRGSVPAHRSFGIVGSDGVERTIEATAFPIITPTERLIGAVAMFWQSDAL